MPDSQTHALLDDAISGFYEAAIGNVTWDVPLRLAATLMKSKNAVFSVRDPVTRKAHFSFGNFGANESYVQSFAKTYATLSPFVISSAVSTEGKSINPVNLIGREEYQRGRFHREWSAPQGYIDYLGAVLWRQTNAIYTIAFARSNGEPLFSEQDEALLDVLNPHVTRALKISERLNTFEKERAELLTTLDSLATPILLIDRKARIRQCNTAAMSLLEADVGLTKRADALVFEDPVMANEFRIASVIEPGCVAVLNSKLRGGLQVQLLARGPLKNVDEDRLLVVIDRPTASTPPVAEGLTERFGITVAELRVLLLLVDGKTVNDIAKDLGISINTVKTHLSHLFQKTGTKSQRSLLQAVTATQRSTVLNLTNSSSDL